MRHQRYVVPPGCDQCLRCEQETIEPNDSSFDSANSSIPLVNRHTSEFKVKERIVVQGWLRSYRIGMISNCITRLALLDVLALLPATRTRFWNVPTCITKMRLDMSSSRKILSPTQEPPSSPFWQFSSDHGLSFAGEETRTMV